MTSYERATAERLWPSVSRIREALPDVAPDELAAWVKARAAAGGAS